jgi:glycogen debranching enzyme
VEDVIQVHDQFYILATASRAGERTAVLQHADTFAVFNLTGDIGMFGTGEQGLYHKGTRHLSRFGLRLNGQRPLLLSARVKEDNDLFSADLTNPDVPLAEPGTVLTRDIVHLFRSRFLWDAAWHERIRLCYYGHSPIAVALSFDLEADFADIFEVRGLRRARRGLILEPELDGNEVRLGYRGLDDSERWTTVEWSDRPAAMSSHLVRFEYELLPQDSVCLLYTLTLPTN